MAAGVIDPPPWERSRSAARDNRRVTVAGMDPGLATFGLVAARFGRSVSEWEGTNVAAFESAKTNAKKYDVDAMEDLHRRTALLYAWLTEQIDRIEPDVVAAEQMSFPRDMRSAAMMSLAWGVITSILEARRIPIVRARPGEWRTFLIGPPVRTRASKKERARRIVKRELASHKAAIQRFPSIGRVIDRSLAAAGRVHARDALGVLCWSTSQPLVRRVLGCG